MEGNFLSSITITSGRMENDKKDPSNKNRYEREMSDI